MTPLNDVRKLNESLTEWSQTVPPNMPWINNQIADNRAVMQCYSHYNPSPVMQFSAISGISQTSHPPNSTNYLQFANHCNFSNNLHLYQNMCRKPIKRSNDCIEDEFEMDANRRAVKLHITEDKVAAIFDNLRIDESNSNRQSLVNDVECVDEDEQTLDSDCDKRSHFIMTDEVQNAIQVEDLTNKLIKDEFDKLSKAVVVWTPQFSQLRDHVFGQQTDDNEEDSESSSDDNTTKVLSSNANVNLNIEEVEFMPFEENDNEMEFST